MLFATSLWLLLLTTRLHPVTASLLLQPTCMFCTSSSAKSLLLLFATGLFIRSTHNILLQNSTTADMLHGAATTTVYALTTTTNTSDDTTTTSDMQGSVSTNVPASTISTIMLLQPTTATIM